MKPLSFGRSFLTISFLIVFGLLVSFTIPCLAASGFQHAYLESQLQQLLKDKKIDQALAKAINAEAASPNDGWYSFKVGELYLYNTKQKDLALKAFKRALEKGYKTGLLLQRRGMCYYHLNQLQKAEDLFHQAISLYQREKISTGEKNRRIADTYVWLTKIYDIWGDYEKYHEAARDGLRFNPKNHWLPGLYANSLVWFGHIAFAEQRYDAALDNYRLALSNGYKGKWLPDLIETVENRKRLGRIKPEFTHRIAVIYVTERNIIKASGRVVRERDVTSKQKRKIRIIQGMMKQVLESFSNGGLTLSFDHRDATAAYNQDAKLKPDNPDHLNLGRYFFENMDRYDSFITCSITRSPAMGLARTYPYVNGVLYGPPRGMFAVNSREHGFEVWLHEFFHVIEWVSGGIGGPAHGYRKELRAKYPGWKGETEFDYYRWHFQTTLPKKGWDTLLHRLRWRTFKNSSLENFKIIEKAYIGIPLEDRQAAVTLFKNADKIKKIDPARAVRLYEQALALSPYLPSALKRLTAYYQKEQPAKARALNKRLALVRSVSDYYKKNTEAEKYGSVMGAWHPESITTSGTTLGWDVSSAITKPGQYLVSFYYLKGWNAVAIEWVALFKNGREIARDTHPGWSGKEKKNITYRLRIPDVKIGVKYVVKAKLAGQRGTDSSGLVLLQRK